MKEITLRAYRSEDLPELLRLFHETVREVCAGEYTREQRDAWAPPPEQLDTGAWDRSLRAHVALVAEAEGRIAGFADLAPPDYLDRLYVGKDFQRRGVASAPVSYTHLDVYKRQGQGRYSGVFQRYRNDLLLAGRRKN